jgi:hypothetical protein
MTENSIKVLNYLKSIHGTMDVTAADVADALGIEDKRVVDGAFTAFQKKKLGVRVPAEMTLEDGTHKTVKLLVLTDEGLAFNPEA